MKDFILGCWGVLAENCTSLEWVTFANIIYDPPASPGADTYPEGTVARTQCDDKYAVFPRSSAERTCDDGSWSGPRNTCRHIKNCTALSIENGHLLHYEVGDIISHGSVVEYGCDDGYEGAPSGRVECRRGNLLPEVPTCSPVELAQCFQESEQTSRFTVQPLNVIATSLSGIGEEYEHGSEIEVTCRSGFIPEEPVRVMLDARRCIPVTTEHGRYSIEILRGTSHEGIYADNTCIEVSLACDPGYLARSFLRTTCQLGTWSQPWPVCVRQQIPCSVPESEGEISMKFFLHGEETRELHPRDLVPGGSFMVARCLDPAKSRLIGDSRRQCNFGEWLGEEPRCDMVMGIPSYKIIKCCYISELYCPEPVVNHGRVVKLFDWIPGRYPITQEITFECDDGYRLTTPQVDTSYHTCILGRWSDEIPQCERDGGEPTQEITGAAASVEATRTP
ncbi:complement receptor type 1-like [Diadema antillarum]|uniref:complement receptor type 1-like n=1 Tax=Diadema antillarum TaxID=105358 RepID=UPI003A85ABFD